MKKMIVHYSMFGSNMYNFIKCHVKDTHIITIQRRNRSDEHSKVMKKIQNPSDLCGSGG